LGTSLRGRAGSAGERGAQRNVWTQLSADGARGLLSCTKLCKCLEQARIARFRSLDGGIQIGQVGGSRGRARDVERRVGHTDGCCKHRLRGFEAALRSNSANVELGEIGVRAGQLDG